jgi:hypothetical protein
VLLFPLFTISCSTTFLNHPTLVENTLSYRGRDYLQKSLTVYRQVDGEWQSTEKTEFHYNSSGQILKKNRLTWNSYRQDWDNLRILRFFRNDDQNSVTSYELDPEGDTITSKARTVNHYDKSDLRRILKKDNYSKKGDDWLLSSQIEYAYDSKCRLLEEKRINDKGEIRVRTKYDYSKRNGFTRIHEIGISEKRIHKAIHLFNSNGEYKEIKTCNLIDSTWHDTLQIEFDYNSKGELINMTQEKLSKNEWQRFSESSYSYMHTEDTLKRIDYSVYDFGNNAIGIWKKESKYVLKSDNTKIK